jgi:hypothetical protein
MTRRLFFVFEQVGQTPLKMDVLFSPKDGQRWSIDFWAKCGAFKRENTLECEQAMTIAEFQKFADEEVAKFMEGVMTDFQDTLALLRLDGQFSKAYELEHKPARHGFKAYIIQGNV